MSSGTPKVPIVQQNGTPILSPTSGPQLRPQFRRQGSSFGAGHVSPMAVMSMPTRVDYSVTKGGLRLWAVLFVFIFLCSSLYALFSAKDLTELGGAVDTDDVDLEVDRDLDDDADEVATQTKKVERDTTASKETKRSTRVVKAARKVIADEESATDNVAKVAAEDDAEEPETLSKEEELFAKLKAKAEARSKKRRNVEKRQRLVEPVESVEPAEPTESVDPDKSIEAVRTIETGDATANDDDDNEEQEEKKAVEPIQKPKRKKKIVVVESDYEKPAEKKGKDEKESEAEVKPQKLVKKSRIKQKCSPMPCLESDDDQVKEVQKKERNIKVRDEKKKKEPEKSDDTEAETSSKGEVVEPEKDSVEEESGKEDKEEKKEAETTQQKAQKKREKLKLKKSQRFGSVSATSRPPQECRGKHCEKDDNKKPRKELLKQRPWKSSPWRGKSYLPVGSDEDNEDLPKDIGDDDDENGQENVLNILEDTETDDDDVFEENDDIFEARYERIHDRTAYKRLTKATREADRLRSQNRQDKLSVQKTRC